MDFGTVEMKLSRMGYGSYWSVVADIQQVLFWNRSRVHVR